MFKDIEICQKSMFGAKEVKVNKNIDLIYIERSFLKKHEIPIDLEILDPKPYSYKHISIKAIFLVVILAVLTLWSLYGALTAKLEANVPILYFLAGLGAVLTLLGLINAKNKSSNLLIFTNRNNGANVFAIAAAKPSKEAVSNFSAELSKRISSIKYPENIPLEQRLDIYSKHLEYLMNEGVLSEEVVTSALKKLEEKSKGAAVLKMV